MVDIMGSHDVLLTPHHQDNLLSTCTRVFILNKAFHMLFGLSYTRQQQTHRKLSQKTDIVENSIQGEDIQNL